MENKTSADGNNDRQNNILGLVHDLRNDYQVLIAVLELARHGADAKAKKLALAAVARIATRCRESLPRVSTVSFLSGNNAGSLQEIPLAPLREVVTETAESFTVIKPPKVVLTVDLPASLHPVSVAIRRGLPDALLNLLKNAGEACPDGTGTVSLLARNLSTGEDPAQYPEAKRKDYVKLSVIDTGNGIPLEHQGRILDGGFTTKSDGTGLGLVNVRKFAQENGGFLSFSTSAGEGTQFHLFLPAIGQKRQVN